MHIARSSDRQNCVVVALDLARKSRRDFLAGFFDQCGSRSEWSVRILQSSVELTADAVRSWEAEGVSGAVVAEDGVVGFESALAESPVPTVIVGSRNNYLTQRERDIVFLRIDDEAIGEFGGEALASLGAFRSAAFLPAGLDDWWSTLRGRGFRSAFAKRRVSVFEPAAGEDLGRFMRALPRPAAILAACDRIAHAAMSSLRDARSIIPESVALLGVDDDEILCNSTRPRLSSVRPDHYQEGVIAQRELDSLMHARKTRKARTVLCGGCALVERESTKPVVPAAALVSRALEFIGRQATHGIAPDDVAAHCGVSRRLIDLRFSELNERTVQGEIRAARLAAVKRMLSGSDDRLASIARRCGFPNANHLKNVFKRETGMSMREWRESHRSERHV